MSSNVNGATGTQVSTKQFVPSHINYKQWAVINMTDCHFGHVAYKSRERDDDSENLNPSLSPSQLLETRKLLGVYHESTLPGTVFFLASKMF